MSVFNIIYTTIRLREVRTNLVASRNEERTHNDNVARLAESIEQMRAMKDATKLYLAFSREELPTVEFMAALEGAVTPGLKVATLDIRPGNVAMTGSALTEQDVIEFGGKLGGMKNIVAGVNAPVTTRGAIGETSISNYSISCTIKSISDIANAYSEPLPDLPPQAEEAPPEGPPEVVPDSSDEEGGEIAQ
ncbi:MAG: hypothetical protein LBT08_05575 [Synergistaceae bacterium]|nr:hypothetical protein [Synergistaceae bacterium]